MGPSFNKIQEIELPPVLMTWKICLLRKRKRSARSDHDQRSLRKAAKSLKIKMPSTSTSEMKTLNGLGNIQIGVGIFLTISQMILFYLCVNFTCKPIAGVNLSIGYIYGKIVQNCLLIRKY